jgi:hypothetical protein
MGVGFVGGDTIGTHPTAKVNKYHIYPNTMFPAGRFSKQPMKKNFLNRKTSHNRNC